MVSGEISAPVTTSVPSGAIVACQSASRGIRASASANSVAWAEGAGVPAGSSSRNLPSSGTQISLQTSQFASACTVIGVAPGTIFTGNSNSPVKA